MGYFDGVHRVQLSVLRRAPGMEHPRAADEAAVRQLFDAHPGRWSWGHRLVPGMTAMRGTRPGVRWRGPAVIAVMAVLTAVAGCGTGALSSASTVVTPAAGPPVSGGASPVEAATSSAPTPGASPAAPVPQPATAVRTAITAITAGP